MNQHHAEYAAVLLMLAVLGAVMAITTAAVPFEEGIFVAHTAKPRAEDLQLVASRIDSCQTSDATLLKLKYIVCESLAGHNSSWCGEVPNNVSTHHDWPSQAVYVMDVLQALTTTPTACLNTTTARDVVMWLDGPMANQSIGGTFMWTYLVFQVQYYDMPRKPYTRIESPWTLGMKCWAFAYLRQFWEPSAIESHLATAGLNINNLAAQYNKAVPLTYNICEEVMANCFQNRTYNPTRNGTCSSNITMFHLGFDWQNVQHGSKVKDVYHP
jgi:hypothetical protein